MLGRDDQTSSENMYEILGQCLRRADDTGINIGYAIVYQCLKTICTIYPNSHLIELASTTISRFLSSESPNLRCTGINGLTLIIQINPNYVMSHQKVIVDCLEENDETLKKNTFELLYKMTNLKNVEVIVDKMMNYLKHTTLEQQSKKDILQKITELTERFAPNKTWFIKIMNDLFVNFGDMITDDILSKLVAIITEWESETDDLNEFKKYTIENYATIVENYSVLSESFVKLMAWVIGEYTCKLYFNDNEKIKGIIQMLSYLLNKTYDDEMTKCLLISAIAKINSNINYSEQNLVNDIMERYSREKSTELQQRCLEYKRLQIRNVPIEKNSFTKIEETPDIDFNLGFLNNFVEERSNGKVYNPEMSEMYMDKFSSNEAQLNVGPYDINSTITSMPSKGGANINSLYESKSDYFIENMKNELNVRAEQKWGAEGYKEETKKPEKPSFIDTRGISSTSSDYNNYSRNDFNKNNERNNKRTQYKKKEEELNVDNVEKRKLMSGLFSGMGGEEEQKEVKRPNRQNRTNNENYSNQNNNFMNNNNNRNNNTRGSSLFDGMTKINDGNNNNNNNNNDLLNMGMGNQNNNNTGGNIDLLGFNDKQQQPSNNNNQGSIDLLGDIFGTGSGNNNNMNNMNNINNNFNQGNQQNQPQNNNILDIFNNDNNMNNQTSNNNMNIFSNFQQPNTNMNNNINTNINAYTPYNINTEKFGELWETFPEEASYEISAKISSPQQYHQIIKQRGNFAAVDIIGDEAISAANYKNQICLVHATIGSGIINFLVKNQNQGLNQEVANYVMGLFK